MIKNRVGLKVFCGVGIEIALVSFMEGHVFLLLPCRIPLNVLMVNCMGFCYASNIA